jgi:hypothetical protein
MRRCDLCGEEMMRSRRGALERWLFSEKFSCRNCRSKKRFVDPELTAAFRRILPMRRLRPRK